MWMPLFAQTPDQVVIIVNRQSSASKTIGEYYAHKRAVPAANICTLDTPPTEWITRDVYTREIQKPVADFLVRHRLQEKALYLVTTMGVPLGVQGDKNGLQNTAAAVDSELAVLYQVMKGAPLGLPGSVPNPFFGQRSEPFRHPRFPLYLVTRLTAYNLHDVKGLIDKALLAKNVGTFVIDARAKEATDGNRWLRGAAASLPPDRVVLDSSAAVLENIRAVIGFASWGSNYSDRKNRFLHFEWLPGAIMMEFVSTNARTFGTPPASWNLGNWKDTSTWFYGSPQTMVADYIREGVTGAGGQVEEPYLHMCPHPEYVLPAYYAGRTLAESFYMGIPGLSWMNIVIGDPLCRLKP